MKLLSKRCQLKIRVPQEIEYYLAVQGKKFKVPILILGEAFSKCQVPEVRHDLAGAVRRAFLGHGISGSDDAEYVKNAMQWYQNEKGNLTVNELYLNNTANIPGEAFEDFPELYERLANNLAERRPAASPLLKNYKRNGGNAISVSGCCYLKRNQRVDIR